MCWWQLYFTAATVTSPPSHGLVPSLQPGLRKNVFPGGGEEAWEGLWCSSVCPRSGHRGRWPRISGPPAAASCSLVFSCIIWSTFLKMCDMSLEPSCWWRSSLLLLVYKVFDPIYERREILHNIHTHSPFTFQTPEKVHFQRDVDLSISSFWGKLRFLLWW